MDNGTAECPVDDFGILLGNEALPVKAGDGDVRLPLHPMVFPGAVLGAVVLYCDDRDIPGRHNWIIYHNNTVGPVNADPVQPHAAGEH